MKVKFILKSDWNLSRPIRVDKAGTELKFQNLSFNIIELIKQTITQFSDKDLSKSK